ncbi:unnamed protein product [Rhizophagus irregularis]|nr:unnamed protein product [Rhizophagus irregularis]
MVESNESYNCLCLDNSYVFQVEVYNNKNDNDDKKFFKIGSEKIPFEKLKIRQLAKLISNNEKLPDKLNLWKVDFDESKLNPNSTEDDIKNLGGVFMTNQSKFIKYFPDGCYPSDEENINIVVVIATTIELERKRPFMEEETTITKREMRSWTVNYTLRQEDRGIFYYVEPIGNDELLKMIQTGEYVALYGARASGKSTRVHRFRKILKDAGYNCL